MIERVIVRGYRIFREFEFKPNPATNIIVGDNESGKSTLLEALALALTGRINGRWAQDELNPYWFNQQIVVAYFESLNTDVALVPPEILIELYLTNEDDALQSMCGAYNSRQDKVPGVRMHIAPDPDYAQEFSDYMLSDDRPSILPTEWYRIDWRDFADERLTRRPKELGVSIIDSRTIRSTAGVDYHTREMLTEFIEPKERAAVAVAHRKARHTISTDTLAPVNTRIAEHSKSLHDSTIGLHMDQSSNASWENGIVPQVANIPFAMAGQGQQAAIKVALAMNRKAESTAYALIEEPENHLSHTGLTKLVARIESLAGNRQVFLTTHSSFVLNRLGLDKLVLLSKGTKATFESLPSDTVIYFKRLSGYDTMRLVLADRVVLVEGPSDEMIFERAFRDAHDGATPMEKGVDVISMAGVSLKRGLQLCAALDRQAAAIRDNDGKDPSHWRDPLKDLLKPDTRDVFIGGLADGRTLEPQFAAVNDDAALREIIGIPEGEDTTEWMSSHKTDWALKLDESDTPVSFPQYMTDAVAFVS